MLSNEVRVKRGINSSHAKFVLKLFILSVLIYRIFFSLCAVVPRAVANHDHGLDVAVTIYGAIIIATLIVRNLIGLGVISVVELWQFIVEYNRNVYIACDASVPNINSIVDSIGAIISAIVVSVFVAKKLFSAS